MRRSGLVTAEVIGLFMVLGRPTSTTHIRAASCHSVSCFFVCSLMSSGIAPAHTASAPFVKTEGRYKIGQEGMWGGARERGAITGTGVPDRSNPDIYPVSPPPPPLNLRGERAR